MVLVLSDFPTHPLPSSKHRSRGYHDRDVSLPWGEEKHKQFHISEIPIVRQHLFLWVQVIGVCVCMCVCVCVSARVWWLPGVKKLHYPLLGLAQLVKGDALGHTYTSVTFQTNYSLNHTFQSSVPSPVCPRQSDFLRAVPTTVVIYRGKQQLICPRAAGTGGTARDRELGLREELHYISHLSEEGVGSDCRIGALAGLRQ